LKTLSSEAPRGAPARFVEGAAIGIALWSILFCFQLLPGLTADTWGVIVFALVGMAANVTRLRSALIAVLIVGATMVVLTTQTSLSNVVASRWVRQDRFPAAPLAAVVVLSASVNPNSTMNSDALDNLLSGLQLIRDGRAQTLVTTTVEQKFPRGSVSSRVDQSRVLALLGNETKWLQTAPTESTRDEALKSAQLLLPLGARQIAVVAAPMHTRRACSAFEAVGFAVTCVPALARSPGGGNPGPWPADQLHVTGAWIYELFGTLKYRSAGWLRKA
jgi:uncharacterized SAM-binding protein YcdF (DUF218 family)